MVNLHEPAGTIMKYLNAFKGSKPALNKNKIMIIRGASRDRIDIVDIPKKLDDLAKELDAEIIDIESETGLNLINLMDDQIREVVEIDTETELSGISNMKADYESMNQFVEIRGMLLPDVGIFICVNKDKSNKGPMFVEIVINERPTGKIEDMEE